MSSGEPFAGAPPNGFCYFKKMEHNWKKEFLYIAYASGLFIGIYIYALSFLYSSDL